MKLLKLVVIILLDLFDDRILHHRFYWLCQWIGNHPTWWDGYNLIKENENETDA